MGQPERCNCGARIIWAEQCNGRLIALNAMAEKRFITSTSWSSDGMMTVHQMDSWQRHKCIHKRIYANKRTGGEKSDGRNDEPA